MSTKSPDISVNSFDALGEEGGEEMSKLSGLYLLSVTIFFVFDSFKGIKK